MSCRDDCRKHIHGMDALVRHAQREVHANRHFVCGAFGIPGSGKSEAMLMFLSQCQGRPLDIPSQVSYRPKDVQGMSRAIFSKGRFLAIQDDEATGEGGHKRGAMTTPNVSSVQDFDAMRGRNQFVGLCGPRRTELDAIKRGHLMWAFELSKDHHLTAWEVQRPSAIFEGDGWLEDRFNLPCPNLDTIKPWGRKLRLDYLAGKDNHMRGGSTDEAHTKADLEADFYRLLTTSPALPHQP